MTRVLVTGSEGFIGKKTVSRLRSEGLNVFTLDLVGEGEKHFIGDIATTPLDQIFTLASPEIVIHAAAQTDVMASFENPSRDFLTNAFGTMRLLDASRKVNVKTFVYIHSGGAIYDSNQPMPLTEDSKEKPISPYGVSKRAGENLVEVMCNKYGINWTSLALSNVYGNVIENPKGVVYEFWKRLSEHKDCQINGARVTRDFVHVDDVIDAIFSASVRPINARVNISSGSETSLLELFELICNCLGVFPTPIFMEPKAGEMLRSCLSNELARELLGWKPKISISEGMTSSFPNKDN
jgi:UDP-glucose 4-epimerase